MSSGRRPGVFTDKATVRAAEGRELALTKPPFERCQLAAFGRSNAGFVSANSRPSAARTLALSVPTRGLRPLERWLCQCQLAAFGRSNAGFVSANSRPSAARTLALSVPTRGLRPLERWLCQCQLAAFGRSNDILVKNV
ncbi:hypothetical protein Ddc_02075 [Ditylenchus destructor]|nr:hypothetical protein Ddc_02075 [Ditylenchus destructor]